MVTSTRKEYKVEKIGDDVLIKKFVGHSNINYLPWMHRSEAHYLLTKFVVYYTFYSSKTLSSLLSLLLRKKITISTKT